MNAGAKPNILLVTKGHPFEREPFFNIFDEMQVNWTHVEQPAARLFFSPAQAQDYDAMVMYDMAGITFGAGGPMFEEPPQDYRDGLMQLLDEGKGLVFLHHAIASWPTWETFAEIVGGRFLYLPGELRGKPVADSGYRHKVRHRIRVLADHPITGDLPAEFPMTDELYLFEVFENSVTPLLASNYRFTKDNFHSAAKAVQEGKMFDNEGWEHDDGSNLVGWVKSYGSSPIVYIQGGDDPGAYANQYYRQLVEQAIHWAAGDDAKKWAQNRRNLP